MPTPNVYLDWYKPGVMDDFLHIRDAAGGAILGGIDRFGYLFGTLANGSGGDTGIFSFTEVPYSPTPVFTMLGANNAFQMEITGNVTSSSIGGSPVPGTVAEFNIVSGGDYTFVWPVNFTNPPLVNSGALGTAETNALFVFDGTDWNGLPTGTVTNTVNVSFTPNSFTYVDGTSGHNIAAQANIIYHPGDGTVETNAGFRVLGALYDAGGSSGTPGQVLVPQSTGTSNYYLWQDAGGGSSPVQTATVTLSSSQISALSSTPITLVAAQGSGTVVVPVSIFAQFKFNTTAFQPGSAYFYGAFQTATSAQANFSLLTAGFIDQSSSQIQNAVLLSNISPQSVASNAAFCLGLFGESGGQISAVTISTGGTAYAVNDTGFIQGANVNAAYRITSVSGGVVTGVTITNPGVGFIPSTTYSTQTGGSQAGSGSGLQLTVSSVNKNATLGDGSLIITTAYTVATLQ